jgi:glycosyltransferase involved in cell wall biosynthesis
MFEVLKKHIFMTRNGIVNYQKEVDISKKDPNLYVFNAAVNKGMVPLVERLWPRIKKEVPTAKLKVIGGYYKFKENYHDEQEQTWRKIVSNPIYKDLDVEFTGIIKQSEIADILTTASFFLFPGAFPETSGISTLESLSYNTPLITNRFGALEETAVDQACYLINYPIQPNSLFKTIDAQDQENKFVETVIRAHKDRYLHQQKMYYCNIIKDITTWGTVALQWKQHFYKKLGKYLPVEDYRKVSYINSRVSQVFGRRFSNQEENYIPRKKEQKIVVVAPMYNAAAYIEKCIESVATQDYTNWEMIIIDDASTDNSAEVVSKYTSDPRIALFKNSENKGAVYNQVMNIRHEVERDSIVMLLDGDDSLVNDNQIFQFYNNLYDGSVQFTYGSCWSMIDNIPLIAQHYPEEVKKQKAYRQHKFNWNMPYTHLRTFKKYLIDSVSDSQFKDDDGEWFKAGGDGSLFYALIESADSDAVKVVSDVVYNYNDASPLNDYKVNGEEQTRNANKILGQTNMKKKILIAIPTARNIEARTFKSIYDLKIPDGYETDFQFFYGYQIDQIRNLIAEWAQRYDYLFSVDSDIAFTPDTLEKLLNHDKEIVSGLYIQRIPGQHTLELYRGGKNVPYNDIRDKGLVEVDSCGFGCVLIDSQVIRDMGYPHFVYKSAINHNDTVSEDTYFCLKAKEKGYKVYADTSILCEHIGQTTFKV